MMEPVFKTFNDKADNTYTLVKYATTSFVGQYEIFKDEWRHDFKSNPMPGRCFIPCPFCNDVAHASFTFSLFIETGTNTSGGVDSSIYEIKCSKCNMFSVFDREDHRYPYD